MAPSLDARFFVPSTRAFDVQICAELSSHRVEVQVGGVYAVERIPGSAGNRVGSFLPKGIVTQTEWDKARKVAIGGCGGRCAGCGADLVPNAPKRSAMSTTVDHIIPRASFIHMDRTMVRHYFLGQHNLAVMHMRCNSAKAAREPTTGYPTATATNPVNDSLNWAARSMEEKKVS